MDLLDFDFDEGGDGEGGGFEGDEETALDKEGWIWVGQNSTAALWAVYALLVGSFNAISTYLLYSISIQVIAVTQDYTIPEPEVDDAADDEDAG